MTGDDGGGKGHRSYGPDQRTGFHRRRVDGFGQPIAVADHQQVVGTFQGVSRRFAASQVASSFIDTTTPVVMWNSAG